MDQIGPQRWLSQLARGYFRNQSQVVEIQEPEPPSTVLTTVAFLDGKGLHTVHEPLNAEIDIVFVHGLTGSRKTWFNAKTKTFWPYDCLPKDIPNARIFLWEYDADVFKLWAHTSSARVSAYGANFCDKLAGRRYRTKTQRRPLIFVCHSLGGLVTMKALLHSNESHESLYKDIVDSTVGVVFLGTPLRGSTLANWGALGADFAYVVKDINKDIVKLLRPDSEVLFELRHSFIQLVRSRAAVPSSAIIIKCYSEELGLTLVGKVVTTESATFEGYPFASIRADHKAMTKFTGSQDPGYIDVMEWLCALVGHAGQFTRPFSHQRTAQTHSPQASMPPIADERLSYKLIPDDFGSIHEKYTATANWNMTAIAASKDFLAFGKPGGLSKSKKRKLDSNTAIDILEETMERPSKQTKLVPTGMSERRQTLRRRRNLEFPAIELQSPEQVRIKEISTWLSDIDHQAMHDFSSSERYKESGVWLSDTKEFQNWRDSSLSTIFWLHGSPGSGKSILSSFVVDALSANESVTVLYFYCHDKQFRSHTSILRSLLKQLYLRSNSKSLMEEFYDEHKSDRPCDGDGTAMKLYFDIFLKILSTSRTYLILDGLDMCTPDGIDVLFSAWRYVSKKSEKVLKLFISGRDRIDVRSKMDREFSSSSRGSGELSLELQPDHLKDIETYIHEQAESVAKDWGMWQISSQELVKHASAMIFDRASGSFSWARRAIEGLKETDGDAQTAEPSKDPPLALESIYEQFLAVIASKDSPTASIAEKTFYLVIFSLGPLRARDIIAALSLGLSEGAEKALKPLDTAKIVTCCKGLIAAKDDELFLVHPSALEYLCQRLNSSLAHTYLAKICLAILTTIKRRQDLEATPGQELTAEEALFAYARKFYMIHGFKAISLDQRIGPFIEADDLPSFEKEHQIGQI